MASTTQPNGNATGGNAAQWTTTETYDAAGNQVTETDPGTTETITTASCSGTTATVSFTAGSNPVPPVNAYVSVSGVNPSGYNGSFQLTGSGSNSVSYTVPSCTGMTYVSGGSMVGETVNTYDGDGNLIFSRDDVGDHEICRVLITNFT